MSFTALMQDLMSIFDAHVHFVDPDRALAGGIWSRRTPKFSLDGESPDAYT